MSRAKYKDLIKEYNKIAQIRASEQRRKEILKELNSLKSDGVGEIIAVGWQFIVTKSQSNPSLITKYFTLSSSDVEYHDSQPHLKFQIKPVYKGDREEGLLETIKKSREEYLWYLANIEEAPRVWVPRERYSITQDPFLADQMTVKIDTETVNNIVGDLSLGFNELIIFFNDQVFKEAYLALLTKLILLAENEDLYPDYLGKDNFAIHKDSDGYKLAIIDPHVVWVGSKCREDVKERLDLMISHFKEISYNV